jgi:hypothetical protein
MAEKLQLTQNLGSFANLKLQFLIDV